MATLTTEEEYYEIEHYYDDRGPLVITIMTIFVVFALITVVLRLVTRKVILKISWQLDDYAITVAMVGTFQEIVDKLLIQLQISTIGFYIGALIGNSSMSQTSICTHFRVRSPLRNWKTCPESWS